MYDFESLPLVIREGTNRMVFPFESPVSEHPHKGRREINKCAVEECKYLKIIVFMDTKLLQSINEAVKISKNISMVFTTSITDGKITGDVKVIGEYHSPAVALSMLATMTQLVGHHLDIVLETAPEGDQRDSVAALFHELCELKRVKIESVTPIKANDVPLNWN